MIVAIGEGDQFGLNAWAIAWPYAVYLSIVKGRISQSIAQNGVYISIGIASPARELRQRAFRTDIGETVIVGFARLLLHIFKIYRAGVNAHRRSGFHSVVPDAKRSDGIG